MIAAQPTQAPATQSPVPSSRRPIPLRIRQDLNVQKMEFRSGVWWVIKDPLGLDYHRLTAEQYCLMNLLDGKRSLIEIRDAFTREFPAHFLQLSDVQRMITDLHQQGLLWNDRPGQSAALIQQQRMSRGQKLKKLIGNPLSIRLPGWNPDRLLCRMDHWFGWIFHPVVLALCGALTISAWMLLLVQFDEFRSRLPGFQQFFSGQNLFWLWVTVGATKVIHEFGHGLTCRHFGSECHQMGVMVLVFSPTLYCDVTDSWMLPNKWQRIAIAAGGMVAEVTLSAAAIIAWWFTTPGLFNHLCLNVFFVSTVTTVIFNANPLLRYDGYYMLSDLVEIPNLRERAGAVLRDGLTRFCLGIDRPMDASIPERGRFWFASYALAATLYSWSVLAAMLTFLFFTLKPYEMQFVAVALMGSVTTGIVIGMCLGIFQILRACRNERVSPVRVGSLVTLMLLLSGLCLTMPLPWYIHAPCLIEPEGVVSVLTTAPGQLSEFTVRPDDLVSQGEVLALLRDLEREDALRRLQVSRQTQLAEIEVLHALEKVSEHSLAIERLQTIDEQLKELQHQLSELTIRAPVSGRVIAAPPVHPHGQTLRRHLSEWSGDISDPSNIGCLLQARTHLMSIAPGNRMQVLLYLDQAHRDDLALGQIIEIKFDHLPSRIFTVPVAEIAREQSDVAPPTLTGKLGGSLVSVTDENGQERLTSVTYVARAILEQETQLLKPGMRGTARMLIERHTAAGWIWRAIRRTVHFRY